MFGLATAPKLSDVKRSRNAGSALLGFFGPGRLPFVRHCSIPDENAAVSYERLIDSTA